MEFSESREISRQDAENILKSKNETYSIYKEEEKEFNSRVREQIGRYTSTLRDALELEDINETGYIPANALKGWFHSMDINLDGDLAEYLIFQSGVLDKIGSSNHLMLEYNKIIEIAEQQDSEPQAPEERKSTDLLEDEYSDNYRDDFEDDKPEQVQESQEAAQTEDKFEDDLDKELDQDLEEPSEKQPGQDPEAQEGEIDDDQMITIAENWLIRIAEELLAKNITVRQLFEGEILAEEIEGEKIELLFPTSFLDGLQKLGINDFSDIENAWLMNVLAKPQLENTILLDELIDIMQNLGIPDDEGDGAGVAEQLGADSSTQLQQDNPAAPTAGESKPKKKGVDLNSLSDDAKNLLLNFLIFLESENMTIGNFFQEVKYEQMVKTKKNKQSSVNIVPAEDFFRLMEENYEIISDVNFTDDVKQELQDILWLDNNYKELLFMKKIDKALTEIKNIN